MTRSQKDNVRVGIIGTSDWAQMMHLRALSSDERCVITAICGRDESRARHVAARFAIPNIYTDYLDLIENENLDAVVICVPNYLHYPITIEALRRKKHVLCEKPLAMNSSEAKEMFERATTAGVAHMLCLTYRWMPTFRYIKQLVDEGYVGALRYIGISYVAGFGRVPNYSWRFDPSKAGCGVIADLGSHAIDLARWLGGEIDSVSSSLTRTVRRTKSAAQETCSAEDSAILTLRYAQDTIATVVLSGIAWLGQIDREMIRIELLGTEGSLWADFDWGPAQTIRGLHLGESTTHIIPIPDYFWNGASKTDAENTLQDLITKTSFGPRALIDAICSGQPATPSFFDGWKVQEVIDAALLAHQSKKWISLRTLQEK